MSHLTATTTRRRRALLATCALLAGLLPAALPASAAPPPPPAGGAMDLAYGSSGVLTLPRPPGATEAVLAGRPVVAADATRTTVVVTDPLPVADGGTGAGLLVVRGPDGSPVALPGAADGTRPVDQSGIGFVASPGPDAVADAGDGFLYVGGTVPDLQLPDQTVVAVQLYDPDGLIATQSVFGLSGTARTTIPGQVTSLTVDEGGNLLLAVDDGGGWQVARLSSVGNQDEGWGGGDGLADVPVPETSTTRVDRVVATGTQTYVAGVATTTDRFSVPTTAVAVARLDASGELDTALGSGFGPVVYGDVSGTPLPVEQQGYVVTALDGAPAVSGGPVVSVSGLLVDGDGQVLVAGTEQASPPSAYVLRLSPNAQEEPNPLDTDFGRDGVTRVLFEGAPSSGLGLDRDGVDRLLVTGSGTPGGGQPQPAAARLTAGGVVDTSFGNAGSELLPCASSGELTSLQPAGERLLGGGGCGVDAVLVQLLRDGTLSNLVIGAAVCDDGCFRTPAEGDIEIVAGPQRSYPDFIPAEALLEALADLQASPLRYSPLRYSPLRYSPLRYSPLRYSPLRYSPLSDEQVRGLTPITLNQVPLLLQPPAPPLEWADLLADTPLEGRPLQTVLVSDVLALQPPDITSEKAAQIALIDLDQIDLSRTSLRNTSIGAFLLGGTPLTALPTPDGGWCTYAGAHGGGADSGCADPEATPLSLEANGVDLQPWFAQGDTLVGRSLVDAPLLEIKLEDLLLSRTAAIGDVLVSSLADPAAFCLAGCDASTRLSEVSDLNMHDDATVEKLLDTATGIATAPTDLTASLGDLVLGLYDDDTLPVEGLDLDTLLAGGAGADPWNFTASVLLDCEAVTELTMSVPVPPDAAISDLEPAGMRLEGTAAPDQVLHAPVGVTLRPPAAPGQPAYLDAVMPAPLGCVGTGRAVLDASLQSPRSLSAITAPATATGGGVTLSSAPRRITVVDPLPTPPGEFDDDRVDDDRLTLGFLSQPRDLDSYWVTVSRGQTLTLTLSHLPADYDLLVYDERESTPGGPQGIPNSPLRYSPLRYSPLRYSPTDDAGPPGGASSGDPVTGPEQPQGVPLGEGRLVAASVNRGQQVEAVRIPIRDDGTSELRIDVVPFNAAQSDEPYLLHTEIEAAEPLADCLGAPAFVAADPVAPVGHDLPLAVPADTQSLILVNWRRMVRLYGADDATELWELLETFAASPLVEGALLDVGYDPGVEAAVAALDADPCSVPRSNDVVTAINRVVDTVREGADELRFVTLIGGDTALPMGRVPDLTELANQTDYAPATRIGKKDNAVSRAFGTQYLLSDDPYAALAPSPFLDTQLFVPDVAVGRLVETPQEIIDSVQEFLDEDGIRDVQGSFTASYDFLLDLGDKLESLKPTVPGESDQQPLNNGTWTREEAEAGLAANAGGFSSVNGHYDNNRALPADQDTAGVQDDLLSAETSLPPSLADGILATVGCNAGVNLEDLLLRPRTGFTTDDKDAARTKDWAQRVSAAKGLFVANTGFGYGDDAAIAYSEKVLAGFAQRLDGSMTVGQALQFAKQGYLDGAVFGVYDHKAMQEATLFGLPQWRVGPSGQVAATVLPGPGTPSLLDLRLVDRSLSPPATLRTTGRGGFYTVGTEAPQVTAYRPVQPKTTIAMEPDPGGRLVHGVLLESLTTREVAIDPLVSVPLVDSRDKQPEPAAEGVYFPSALQQVLSRTTPQGLEDLLVLVSGQFRGGSTGVQRLVTDASAQVTYSGSTDFEPPTIETVDGRVEAGQLQLDVTAPSSDTIRVVALYLPGVNSSTPRTWSRLELQPLGGGLWRATAPMPPGTTSIGEFYVQAMDADGNVAVNSNKGANYVAEQVGGPVTPTDPGPLPPASPSPSASASASPSLSTSPSASPSPGPDVTLSATTITARQSVVVSGVAPPGTWLTIHAYSRPSTTYREVRQFTVPANGRFSVPLYPQSNTRLYAAVDGSPGRSVVVLVRPLVNLAATAIGGFRVDFSGRVLPHQKGVLITIYRRAQGGKDVITAQTSTDSTGRYALRRRFLAPGSWAFFARSGSGLVNVSGTSPFRIVNIR